MPINIIEFSSGSMLMVYPEGLERPGELGLWIAVMTLGTGKFAALFGALFGAGLVLFTDRASIARRSPASVYLPRLGWLWFFGMLHAYLIWYGDILVAYAVTGFVLFWFRGWSTRTCLIVAAAVWGMMVGSYALCALATHIPGVLEELESMDLQAMIEEETTPENDALRGNWVEQMPTRALYSLLTQVLGIPLYLFWYAVGFMLAGMALMKSGFFAGKWKESTVRRTTAASLAAGILLGGLGFTLVARAGWSPLFSWGFTLAYAAIPMVAFAYAGGAVLWVARGGFPLLRTSLAAVGRMAFTNYIGQSFLMSLIFYGHGLGLRGELGFAETMAIVPAIWIPQVILSRIWLSRFPHGPLEWIWRRLTYGKAVPLRRRVTPPPIP